VSNAQHIVKRLIEGVDDIDPKDMLLGFYTKPLYVYRGREQSKADIQWTGCYYEGKFVGKYRYNDREPYVLEMGGWEVVPENDKGGWLTYVERSEANAIKRIKKVSKISEPRRVRENVDDFDPKEMAMSLRYQLYPAEPDLGDLELYNVSTADGSSHIGRIAFEDHSKRPAYASKGEWEVMEKWARYRKSPWAAYSRYQTGIVYFATREAALEYILRAANVNESADDPDDLINRHASNLHLQTTDMEEVYRATRGWPEFDEIDRGGDPKYIRYFGNVYDHGLESADYLNWNLDLEWNEEVPRACFYFGYGDHEGCWRELADMPPVDSGVAERILADAVQAFMRKLSREVIVGNTHGP
jgi:hypothetical protein